MRAVFSSALPIGVCRIAPMPKLGTKGATPTIRTTLPLGGFWGSLFNVTTGIGKGLITGAATGNPAGAVIGAAAGGLSAASKGSKSAAPATEQPQLGPLATVGTGTILGVSLGAAALLVALVK